MTSQVHSDGCSGVAPPRAASLALTLALGLLLASVPTRLAAAEPDPVRTRTGPFLDDRLPADLPQAGLWTVVPAFPQLTFPNPVGMVPEPGSHRLWVLTREGRIHAFENDPAARETEVVLDISAQTQGWDDSGLLGLAFHPRFAEPGAPQRGFLYVFYQYSPTPTAGPQRPPEKTASFNRLSRFTVPVGSRKVDPDSELILLDLHDRSVWHNGGSMFFDPTDGFLYLSLGDEGGIDGEFGNAQRLDGGLFSGVIRIDVDQDPTRSHPIRRQPRSTAAGASRTANYFIPDDNPFQDPAGGVLEEFWCLGLRSPHRMSLDPVTGEIWLGDVGQGAREEVNLIVRGGNYQWAYKEGSLNGPIPRPAVVAGIEMPPVWEYPHTRGTTGFDGDNCVIGGYVYRGREHAADLAGQYVFGDNGSGRIWALSRAGGTIRVTPIATMPPGFNYTGLSSFGVDHDQELYLCQMGDHGRLLKLARPVASQPPPALLSATGAFADLASLRPVPGLVPFEINSPLWSDGARKARWMALPASVTPDGAPARIAFRPEGEWSFPAGTVFVKHFELGVDDADPTRVRRLETRFLVRDTRDGIYGITYRWRPDQSEADLLPGTLAEEFSIVTAAPRPVFPEGRDLGLPSGSGSDVRDAEASRISVRVTGDAPSPELDRLRFAGVRQDADFDLRIQLTAFSVPGDAHGAIAGFAARESGGPEARHLWIGVAGDADAMKVRVSVRNTPGTPALFPDLPDSLSPAVALPTWFRLRREGSRFTAYTGPDGLSWTRGWSGNPRFAGPVDVGPAVGPGGIGPAVTAEFDSSAPVRAQTWSYPSPRDCLSCHTPLAGHVLGVRTSQLNRLVEEGEEGSPVNQLQAWNRRGCFDPPLDETTIPALPRLVPVDDPTVSLERRVRSYLAANCAHCHRPAGVRANFDARYETPLVAQGLVNGTLFKSLGIEGARVISPGDPARSVLFHRLGTLGEERMPPLARNVVDPAAVSTVEAWIASLPPVRIVPGLRAEYFNRLDLTGLQLTRVDPNVNFDWGSRAPIAGVGSDRFSIRWSGDLEVPASGSYTFHTYSDDGVRLWIDGLLIIDDWVGHAPKENQGALALDAGRKHSLRLEYFDDTGGALVRLFWSGPGIVRQSIPNARFSTPQDPVLGIPQPALRVVRSPDGSLRLILDAEQPAAYLVESSADLLNWTELLGLPGRTGLIEIRDDDAPRQIHRFYRAVVR